MNSHWLTGFINADGNFGVYLSKEDSKSFRCEAQFNIVQLNSSRIILEHIQTVLGFGSVYPLIPDSLLSPSGMQGPETTHLLFKYLILKALIN